MASRTLFVDTKVVPFDVFTYQDDDFYNLISQIAGPDEAALLKIQGIRTVNAFLRIPNIFDVFNINVKEVNDIKTKTCFILENNNYIDQIRKQGELLKNTNRKRRTISNVSSNTTATPNNSLQTITDTIQFSTTTTSTIEAIDHHSFIIQSIDEWCLKHADEVGISDLKLVEGTDYVVTLSSGFAHIRCGCHRSARLPKQGRNFQLSNFYRHLKVRRCSMLKAKQPMHNINSNPSNNISIDEEISLQRTTTGNIPILSSDSTISTDSKRHSSLSVSSVIIQTMTHMLLPDDVLSYHDDVFYDLVRDKCGIVVEEMFHLQNIRSVQSLLRINDVFDFINYDSAELTALKKMVGFELQNGKFQIKAGIRFDVDAFIEALRNVSDKLLQPMSTDHQCDDLIISQEFLVKHPLLKTVIEFYLTIDNNDNDSNLSFLTVLIDNIIQNLALPKNAYRYNEQVQKFAMSLYILADRNAYEFVRMNIPGAIPAVSTIQSSLDREENQIIEVFPKHRKEASKSASSATVSTIWPLTKNDIQQIVSCAFDDVFELLSTLGVDSALTENNIHTLKNLNSFILNKMNTMTNTIDESTPEAIESDSESDDIFDYHDSIDEEGNGTDNDYDSPIYELNDVTGDIFPEVKISDKMKIFNVEPISTNMGHPAG
ncbi:unnamed protein product [Rotaria sordida]|uniref:THAP9-like helix-turn-helix domain-containing protein n=1 Tax=Rotaria sordida TaxID=392033 RepID=A0A814X2N3_9BILA|nr:unnamed protein product [Rotaria sordida]CAF1486658.1 unnamed protein product [Rotaria sordida]